MGILSSSVSITRYLINGDLEKPVIDTVMNGLKKNTIADIDEDDAMEKISGWTDFENPYQPDFENKSCLYGPYFIFALRIDKKRISSKIIKKQMILEINKRLKESEREHLSKNEKKEIKENIILKLSKRIPATPDIYDIVWNYEQKTLWFFSNLKAANEELENLFSKSFKLNLIRWFPYTAAHLDASLPDDRKDRLESLSPQYFSE